MTTRWLDPWPPLPADAWLRPPAERLPFPLDDPGCRVYALARHGLWHGLRALALGDGEVLVPAYHHGSEVEAMRRCGLDPVFYGGDDGVTPDATELAAAITPRTRALHLVHYLGFPQDAAAWRAFCDAHGLVLIEDCAQSWLVARDGVPAGARGDLALFSLYKAFGLPDGGAVRCRAPLADPGAATARRGLGDALERTRAAVEQRVPIHRRRPEGPYDPAADFELGDPRTPPTRVTLPLLARVFDAGAPAARRAHYRMLLDVAGENVPAPFAALPEGASPWVFPIEVADKGAARERLARAGVGSLDLWSVPHPSLDAARFPAVAARRAHTIAVPVHQELRPADVERIATALADVLRRPRRAWRCEIADAPLAEPWDELAAATTNPFLLREWIEAWQATEATGQPLRAVCRRADGTIAGVVALERRREGPLRVLRLAGHGPSDELAPICAPADREAVAAALRRWLPTLAADLFVGDVLPAADGWGALLGAQRLDTDASPVMAIAGLDWPRWLQTRSATFRQRVQRLERRLLEGGDVTYRLTDAPRLDEDLTTLFALHERRFGPTSQAFTPARRALHRRWAPAALERGWLRLWLVERAGTPIAAWYGFRFAGAECFYQSGRDPDAPYRSLGLLLLCHTMREAMADGMREYRLLRGDEAYKAQFADRDDGLETVALPLTARGHAWLAARGGRALARRVVRRGTG
jgi:perosamine synthetase